MSFIVLGQWRRLDLAHTHIYVTLLSYFTIIRSGVDLLTTVMAGALRWYQSVLKRRPLLTQSLTTAVLFGTGDVLAQQAVERKGFEKHEYARTGRMALYGGCVFGPAATLWYRFLSAKINFKSHNATIFARVATDQLVFSTTNMFLFLSSMSYMEGGDPREKLRKRYWEGLKANYMVWPFVQAINFKYVPLEHRVLVVNIVSLGWNCFLSFLNSEK